MNRIKRRIMLLIPVFTISGCAWTLPEDEEKQQKVTISILAGQSTPDVRRT